MGKQEEHLNKIGHSKDNFRQFQKQSSKSKSLSSNEEKEYNVNHCYGCGSNSHSHGSANCPENIAIIVKSPIILLLYVSKINRKLIHQVMNKTKVFKFSKYLKILIVKMIIASTLVNIKTMSY